MGERLATAAKAIYIVNVPTLANTLWAHTKEPKEDDAWNTFLALVHQIGVPKTAVRTVEAELLSRLREKDWEPAAADNTPKEPETEVVTKKRCRFLEFKATVPSRLRGHAAAAKRATGLVMLAARTQSGSHKHHKPRGLVCRSPVYFEGSWPLSRHMLHSPCPPALYTNSLGGVLTPPTPYYKLLGGAKTPKGNYKLFGGGSATSLDVRPPHRASCT